MRRLRRLQLAQVGVLVVLCASLILVALLFTHAIQDARADGKASARNESELLQTAADLRLADLGFWAGDPAERGARVAPTTRPRLARAQDTLRRLRDDEIADGLDREERGMITGAMSGVAALRAFAADAGPLPPGPRAALRARRESALGTAAVDLVGAWLLREHTAGERADARADRLTSRLTHWLVGLIGLLCACGLAICLVLERARRRVKQGLEAQMARQSALAGSLQDGLEVLSPDGEILEVNQRLCEMLGRRPEDLVGRRMPFPHWPEEEYGRLRDIRARVAGAGRGEFDVVYRRHDGERFPAILSIAAIRGDGGAVVAYVATIKDNTERKLAEAALAELAREQGALHRVSSAVAAEDPPELIFALAAGEAAGLLGVDHAAVVRFEDDRITIVSHWDRLGRADHDHAGTRLAVDGGTASAEVARTGLAARVEDLTAVRDPVGLSIAGAGAQAAVAVPIGVAGRLWGALGAGSDAPLPDDAEARLARLAELVGLAIQNAEARERLAARAATDPLTGLANHRTFHEVLAAEAARAGRHGRDLSLVLLDLDHFKHVNVVHGHQIGDEILSEVARRLAAVVRHGDVVARVGGEEFAVILPGSDDLSAWETAERLRDAIRGRPFPDIGLLTASAGVCGLRHAASADELYRFADGALYWAKVNGRDVTFRYSPEVVQALSAEQRAQHLERAQALQGVRLLAQAVDAKDSITQRHSERVADLAERIARELGWSSERAALLRQAALVHDVGKIGVPDRVLLKPGRLSEGEHELVKDHVALSARLVADILTPEQVAWVRSHHERWDGRGYPDGLAGGEIPQGAQIIALADAWDAMTVARPYGIPRTLRAALGECRRGVDRQWGAEVVEALERLWAADSLDAPRRPSEPHRRRSETLAG